MEEFPTKVLKMPTRNIEKMHETEFFPLEPLEENILRFVFPKKLNVGIKEGNIEGNGNQIKLKIDFVWGMLNRKGNIEATLESDYTGKTRVKQQKVKVSETIKGDIEAEVLTLPENIKNLLIEKSGKGIKNMEIENGQFKVTFLARNSETLTKEHGLGTKGATIMGNSAAVEPLHHTEEGVVRLHQDIVRDNLAEREQQRIEELNNLPRVVALRLKYTEWLETDKDKQAKNHLVKLNDLEHLEEYFKWRTSFKDAEDYEEDLATLKQIREIDVKYKNS